MPRCSIIACSLLSLGLSAALSSSLAHADPREIELVPSCAEIDTTRDTLDPQARDIALRRLTRTLERADLLVVTTGCVDHYAVSHETRDGAIVVRIAGPHGIRRIRDGSIDGLDDMYARMVDSLLEPPPDASPESSPDAAPTTAAAPAASAAPVDRPEYAEADSRESLIDAVAPDVTAIAPDRLLYASVGLGSLGVGYQLGYRRAASEHADFDIAVSHQGNDSASVLALGVEALYLSQPRAISTPYIGGGVSLASQHDGLMSGGGLRAEVTAGYAFARGGASRWCAQLDLGLPLYEMQGSPYTGQGGFRPTVSASLGVGF